jgi:hypothetical protein
MALPSSQQAVSVSSQPSQLQEITKLIDDFRGDEVSVRVNAVRKLPFIASFLGTQRTREELLPYLKGMFLFVNAERVAQLSMSSCSWSFQRRICPENVCSSHL